MKLELLQDGVVIFTRDYGNAVLPGAPPVPPPSAPPSVTPSVPPSAPPAAPPDGWVVQMNPTTISYGGTQSGIPFNVENSHIYVFQAPPNVIHVHPVKFNRAYFTGPTATITSAWTSTNQAGRQMVISDTPGLMIPVDPGHFGCNKFSFEADTLQITFDSRENSFCGLDRDTQYYLNIKATEPGVPMDYILQPSPNR
mgnify:CR=1 FL=1